MDVTAAGLGLALNTPSPRPLASCRLHHPDGGALVLGVLGASHVVTVEHATCRFSEQVSCAARSHGIDLPESTDAPGYRLESRTDMHDEVAFRRVGRQLRERCAREASCLGGMFPGDNDALTALAADPDGSGWCWRTWHLYPTTPGGTVVYTTSWWQP
jgi:hypothetical protein